MSRIAARFAKLKAEGRAAFVPYISAGDPSLAVSQAILNGLPKAGADMIELGMPFTDPMADGPAVQAAGLRALKAGATLKTTLAMVAAFRKTDADTPIVLMGYCNSLHAYGIDAFVRDATTAGVDGAIIVDMPPEEDAEFGPALRAGGIDLIRLATPTTTDARLPAVLNGAAGWLYYVSIAGVTGTKDFDAAEVEREVTRIKRQTDLPVAVGFGVKTADHVAAIARFADAAVVGSAIVNRIGAHVASDGSIGDDCAKDVLDFVNGLSAGVHRAG